MPDPDPQTPQTRSISTARWLLMLVPSVPIILAPMLADARARSHHYASGEEEIGNELGMLLWTLCASVVLSFIMGLLLEKWRHGAIMNFSRATGYALTIFITNCVIAFAGCCIPAMISRP
ncbi:MAG: hypothetical protein WCK55_05120 [Verrucomicrobiota bacterium]